MNERLKAIEQLVLQFPPGNLNRKLWALVLAELKDLGGRITALAAQPTPEVKK